MRGYIFLVVFIIYLQGLECSETVQSYVKYVNETLNNCKKNNQDLTAQSNCVVTNLKTLIKVAKDNLSASDLNRPEIIGVVNSIGFMIGMPFKVIGDKSIERLISYIYENMEKYSNYTEAVLNFLLDTLKYLKQFINAALKVGVKYYANYLNIGLDFVITNFIYLPITGQYTLKSLLGMNPSSLITFAMNVFGPEYLFQTLSNIILSVKSSIEKLPIKSDTVKKTTPIPK